MPLSTITDPALVLSAMADTIGARREPGLELIEAVRVALGDDRTLVVLDNVEQIPDVAGELAVLLDAVPAVVLLVTSRQILHLRAERQYPLAPLALAPSVALFTERVAAVRPGFTVDAGSAATVAEICRRLDGLPLAIELAAARARLLPPAALLARLEEKLDVLGSGPVDLPARQRTLRATMDWSFGLLGPHEQAVFTRLAVFSGGWTLEAAEAVCGRLGEPDVLDALSTLLDTSLLVESDESSSEPRLDMLETVRAYAAEKLAVSPDRSQIERRHTDWVLAAIDPPQHPGPQGFRGAIAQFDRERANVRAAVQRAVRAPDADTAGRLIQATIGYMALRDAMPEAMEWLEQLLPRVIAAPPDVRGRLLVVRALLAGVFEGLTAVRPWWEEGRRLLPDDADHAADRVLVAYVGIFVAVADGSVDEAVRQAEETAALSAALGLELPPAFAAMLEANFALLRGDLDVAEQHYLVGVERGGRLGEESLMGEALSLRGLVLLTRGDVTAARRSILDGAAANRRGGQASHIASSLDGLAGLALPGGRPDVAARALAATAAARQMMTTPAWPAFMPLVEDLAARAREQLGDDAYAAACSEGRRWPLVHALDRTLEALSDGQSSAAA